jgi:hypothetical protein
MEISKTLTGQECQDLTLFAVDTPANLLAPQENDEELMTLDTCGHGLETPLATYDPATQFWKTSEDISLWGELQVIGELAEIGYDAEWRIVSAAGLGAPHRRDRIIIVAYPNNARERTPGGHGTSKGRR